MELYISLPEIEVIPHVGGGVLERKSKGMKVVELDIRLQPGGWPYSHTSTNALEFVEFALSGKEIDRRLVLGARPEFAVQGHPGGQLILGQGLRLSAYLRVILIFIKCRCGALRILILGGRCRNDKKRGKECQGEAPERPCLRDHVFVPCLEYVLTCSSG